MKISKHPNLKLNSKVLFVFENKKNNVKHNNPTDPTTQTMTMTTGTGMGITFGNFKESR